MSSHSSQIWSCRARWAGALALFGLVVFTGPGCSSDTSTAGDVAGAGGKAGGTGTGGAGGMCMGGGPATGAADTHCTDSAGMPIVQETGTCVTGSIGAGGAGDGASGAGGAPVEEPAPINFGHEADDDDCKYHITFTNTCVALNQDVTFTVTLTRKSDGMPATAATPNSPEIFLEGDNSHISPSNNIKAPEGPAGVYKIGPIRFDASGRWVLRLHFFESCSDIPEDSPHGHAAFFIDVP